MSVYRLPFRYSQHYAARVEWQPQPSWEFDGVAAEWAFYGTTGTFVSDVILEGKAYRIGWHNTTGTISFPITLTGVAYEMAWAGTTGELTATPLTIPGTGISARINQNSINARFAQKRIEAR